MAAAARCIADPRSPLLIKHGVRDMLRQRVDGRALGWEDLNGHGALRQHVALQTAVGVEREVASAPTLCRREKWAGRATAWRLREVLVDRFMARFDAAPRALVLDIDATDNPLYSVPSNCCAPTCIPATSMAHASDQRPHCGPHRCLVCSHTSAPRHPIAQAGGCVREICGLR